MSTTQPEAAQLLEVLKRTLSLLDDASALVEPAGIQPPERTVRLLDRAKAEVLRARDNLQAATATESGQAPSAAAAKRLSRPEPPREPGRNHFVIRAATDVDRLLPRLLAPWKLPRIEVLIDTIPVLEVQRAQHRITRTRDAAAQQIVGPTLAGVVILFGAFRIVAFHEPWTGTQDMKDFGVVILLGSLVWVLGKVVEIIWCRVWLLRVLLRLRRLHPAIGPGS